MHNFYGEIAALLTAVCWTFTSVVFTKAAKQVGSFTVNHIRLWMALVFQAVLHIILFGTLFPFDIEGWRLFYLGISGVIGFVVGDSLLLEAFVLIGARLSMLMMLLSPVFGAFLAWVVLGEVLAVQEIIGILVTISGIAWVVSEKNKGLDAVKKERPRGYVLGIVLGIGGAVGQAVGLLFSRIGLEGGYSAITANHVRVTFSVLVIGVITLVQGKMQRDIAKMKNKKALLEITGGTLTGPVFGVILSLVAIAYTHIGVASTLMSLSPVLLIPVSHIMFKERVTLRSVMGTIIALIGVVFLFFS